MIKSGELPGNKFAGQLLVKIDREVTKNPRPLEKKTILFNKQNTGRRDTKSEIFAMINKDMMEKGKKLQN